ncbi:hypothetical protein EVAR_34315_1 [Eumeta japonica]|uniref:Uncharacterized protein n=1 Tax=Eumeta variegata TaxID=151549 RepID=A0A4C1VE86_EUMVA|nr:hypothetical protein EVAR_34315_1 [Eumeta japonica]
MYFEKSYERLEEEWEVKPNVMTSHQGGVRCCDENTDFDLRFAHVLFIVRLFRVPFNATRAKGMAAIGHNLRSVIDGAVVAGK